MSAPRISSQLVLVLISAAFGIDARAQATENHGCEKMEVWDYGMSMCMPRAMPGMPMTMIMLSGNSFFTQTAQEKPRGHDSFAVPNMIMADVGTSAGANQYVNVDFMGTLERWTLPNDGYPELMQIGETHDDGRPFLDFQHPHSSPIMGLTLSDTVSFGDGSDHFKFSIAPRGESTDGPVPFMHRPTAMVNPDAPLGHHIGQDVGHISSSVIGAEFRFAQTTVELSTFNGTEPEPTKVDLPVAPPNSYAARWTQQFSPQIFAMASAAFVKNPEPQDPDLDHLWRYSASIYHDAKFGERWKANNSLIWGLINGFDHAAALNSFAEEFWLHTSTYGYWTRIEVLQRTPNELLVGPTDDPNRGRWVTALTFGGEHEAMKWTALTMNLGASITQDFIPSEFQNAYGKNPLTARVFLRVSGMKMWDNSN